MSHAVVTELPTTDAQLVVIAVAKAVFMAQVVVE